MEFGILHCQKYGKEWAWLPVGPLTGGLPAREAIRSLERSYASRLPFDAQFVGSKCSD